MEPICEFKDKKQLQDCCRDWQHKLMLDHWVIYAGFHTTAEYPNEYGHVEFSIANETATITILDKMPTGRITRNCAELSLIHELLHLKLGWLEANETYEAIYLDEKQHQLIHELARSLIMAKYNLDYDWFKNPEVDF